MIEVMGVIKIFADFTIFFVMTQNRSLFYNL